MDGGGRVVSGTTTEVERLRTNTGHIRVKPKVGALGDVRNIFSRQSRGDP
jgi:hypothetical protein